MRFDVGAGNGGRLPGESGCQLCRGPPPLPALLLLAAWHREGASPAPGAGGHDLGRARRLATGAEAAAGGAAGPERAGPWMPAAARALGRGWGPGRGVPEWSRRGQVGMQLFLLLSRKRSQMASSGQGASSETGKASRFR